jgi:hypothetical protein
MKTVDGLAAGRRQWAEIGSFALGVMAEALAHLRRRPGPRRLTTGSPPATAARPPALLIDPDRPRPRRRPPGPARPRVRRVKKRTDPSSPS